MDLPCGNIFCCPSFIQCIKILEDMEWSQSSDSGGSFVDNECSLFLSLIHYNTGNFSLADVKSEMPKVFGNDGWKFVDFLGIHGRDDA